MIYGKVNDLTKGFFVFDKIYNTFEEMRSGEEHDGIFQGRYVIIAPNNNLIENYGQTSNDDWTDVEANGNYTTTSEDHRGEVYVKTKDGYKRVANLNHIVPTLEMNIFNYDWNNKNNNAVTFQKKDNDVSYRFSIPNIFQLSRDFFCADTNSVINYANLSSSEKIYYDKYFNGVSNENSIPDELLGKIIVKQGEEKNHFYWIDFLKDTYIEYDEFNKKYSIFKNVGSSVKFEEFGLMDFTSEIIKYFYQFREDAIGFKNIAENLDKILLSEEDKTKKSKLAEDIEFLADLFSDENNERINLKDKNVELNKMIQWYMDLSPHIYIDEEKESYKKEVNS